MIPGAESHLELAKMIFLRMSTRQIRKDPVQEAVGDIPLKQLF